MVSNTGNVRLTGVKVLDEQGGTPTLLRGDGNGNEVLDVGERWEYRSNATITTAVFAAGEPVVRRASAVSDQSRSEPDEVTIRLEPPVVRPGGTVPVPRKVRDVTPQYPSEAQAAGIQGEVRIDVTINANGRVREVQVVQSTAASADGPAPQPVRALLEEAAVAAARQWEYAPTVVNGVPVRVISTANIRFILKPPAPVRVGGNIKTPERTRFVAPVYPPEAASANVQGIVIIEATIDASGRVTDARILRSIPLLDQAALDAVRQWEYAPTLLNGVPVPLILTVTVSFTLK
jgi:protein TonB